MPNRPKPIDPLDVRLRNLDHRRIACVGSLYMDTEIYGLKFDKKGNHCLDFSTEVPVTIKERPGGSIYYVARYLQHLGLRPLLISMVSKHDKKFEVFATKDGLSKAIEGVERFADEDTAKTIHFIRNLDSFNDSAMYTDRHVLRNFGWGKAFKHLEAHNCMNCAVYIAGIFKTGLHRDLGDKLKNLKREGAINFLDHGRIHEDQVKPDYRRISIKNALPLVDVYLTSREELKQYVQLVLKDQDLAEMLADDLFPLEKGLSRQLSKFNMSFPPILIVKDDKSKPARRFVAMRDITNDTYNVIAISMNQPQPPAQRIVGVGNVFNAVFIDEFLKLRKVDGVSAVAACAEKAQYCLEQVMANAERTLHDAVASWTAQEKVDDHKQDQPNEPNTKLDTPPIEQNLNILDDKLSMNELRELCLSLRVDVYNLEGGTKRAKIGDLLRGLIANDRMDKLLGWCERNRPDIKLVDI